MASAVATPSSTMTTTSPCINEAHVATVAGTPFCCPGYIRLSYATSDENLREAAKRIAAALAKLA